ncbi:MAG TPA: tripartite tricarboxylate transporter substrate binding protein [Xanthobacteraceae bacterium]|nr:tripartite tricarboxylate transporter substrate binding protein [Xanthobacteraceae bacterium]
MPVRGLRRSASAGASVRGGRPRKTGLWRFGVAWAATSMVFACLATASAEDFPSRPIRIVVPAGAGGPPDVGARLAAKALERTLNTPVVVENRNGRVNVTESYLAGEADGYTILVGTSASLTILPAAKHVSYDVERDFIPLGTIWRTASALEVRASMGVRTLGAFIAAAKAHPGTVTIGSGGVGTPAHLTIELLKREAGIDVIHVPFRSTGESLTALIGGQIDALFGDVQIVKAQLEAGTIVALAVTGPVRVPALPEVPTTAEAGLPGVVSEPWFGLVVSAKTPPAIVKRLQEALAAAHDDPVYRNALAQQGASAGEPGPEALGRLIRTDAAKWRSIITAAGIDLD